MALKIYDLTHTYRQFMPEWPSSPGVDLDVLKFHARDGLWELSWSGIMHRCTHMDAPLHVTENTPDIMSYPLWRLAGPGVCVSIPKEKWGVITPADLEAARPEIREGDIVMINTGFHRKWADTDAYFAHGCGISGAGANWLVSKKVKLVGYGCQANDHPLATKLVDHGLGPTHPHLIEEYKRECGRDPKEDFPLWEDAHKNLMVKGGIPGIENVGGDLDEIAGTRCFFIAFPWRWRGGDGCIVRVLAVTDPDGGFRFEKGD
jgi:kynurenine formamidase